jgi:hypothetical protein
MPRCGERQFRAHTGPFDLVLRALAARKLMQQRKFLCRRAVGKPVVGVYRCMRRRRGISCDTVKLGTAAQREN